MIVKSAVIALVATLAVAGLAGCKSESSNVRSSSNINHGGYIQNTCAAAVARKVGVSPDDVVVTRSTISEGTGNHVVYVGVPYGKADWVCEADRDGRVVNVFYSG